MPKRCINCNKDHTAEYDEDFCSPECESEWNENLEWVDANTQDSDAGLICPYCGFINKATEDPHKIYDEDLEEYECASCSKPFDASARCSWTFYTVPKKELIEEEE